MTTVRRPNRSVLTIFSLFAALISITAQANTPKSTTLAPALQSHAVYVVNETDASVVLSRHADIAKPIASITKLMTTLVVLEAKQPMDEVLEIAAEDAIGAKTVTSRLQIGTRLTRADLMHLALMSSENRAAHALARHYPGGLAACIREMNAKAKALGMTSAHFEDPTGLSSENVASSEDLVKLVQAASENKKIHEYSTDEHYTVKVGRHDVEFRNTDALVHNPSWNIVIQKTGYIAEAGRCLVMKTVFAGKSFVIVLLDSTGKYTRVADAKRIRKWLEARLMADSNRTASHHG
jgi:D-alanyl-D-alanine endopeptidase (penicillin-binding protein 7)